MVSSGGTTLPQSLLTLVKIQASQTIHKFNGRLSDPAFSLMLTIISYFEVETEVRGLPVFPFHKVCYEMFERAMDYTKGSPSVDRNLLYHVMAGLSGHYQCHLEINYGAMSGMDHCWVSKPGEEVRPAHI